MEALKAQSAREAAEVSAERAHAAESTSLLHKMEAELAALSEAYTALEQDAFVKETEIRQLQARLCAETAAPPSSSPHRCVRILTRPRSLWSCRSRPPCRL